MNSYGEEFGENGYFYVSYDDFSIEQVMLEVSNMEEDKSNAVKYSYQYDELGGNFQIEHKAIQFLLQTCLKNKIHLM